MSVNTQTNEIQYPGYKPKAEETYYNLSAPTLTTGYTEGDVWFVTSTGTSTGTITAAYRYDATLQKWVKFPGGAGAITPRLTPVVSRITTPPSTPNDQQRHIIIATATGAWAGKEGQIAEWDATNNTWVYYVPTNLDQTTITTGAEAGVYQYDSTSKTWVLIKQGIELVEPAVNPESGRYRFTSEKFYNSAVQNPWLVIANDAIMVWGAATTAYNAGDGTASGNFPRKLSFTWHGGTDTAYSKSATYAPKFVDAVMNVSSGAVLGLDSLGKVWTIGTVASTGLTTTGAGTTLMTRAPTYGLTAIPYFQTGGGASAKISKLYTMPLKSNTTTEVANFALATDGTVHCVGRNSTGQLGIGTTVDRVNWATYPLTNVKHIHVATNGVAMVRSNGDLYFSGNDSSTMIGAAANKTVPTLVTTGVSIANPNTFAFMRYDNTTAYVVKADNTFWASGANAQGQQGRGNTTAVTVLTQVPGINDAWKVYGGGAPNANYCVLLRTDGSITFAGTNLNGVFGYGAAGTSYSSFVTPTGAFQGTVVDVIPGGTNVYLLTTNGDVWVSGTLDAGGVGTSGLGSNRWVKMSFPEPVLGIRTAYSNGGLGAGLAITANHKIYCWGNWPAAVAWNAAHTNSFYAPTLIPVEFVDNGIELSAIQAMTI